MTATCPLSNLSPWNASTILRPPVATKRVVPEIIRPPAPRLPASFSRLWRDALEEEDRVVAPFERMGFGLLAFAAGVTVTTSLAASLRFVELFPTFTAWAGRLLGAG